MLDIKIKFNRWHFLAIVLITYIGLYFYDFSKLQKSVLFSINILKNVVEPFLLVFILMLFLNHWINNKNIVNSFAKLSNCKKWLVAIVGGIISSGPIYMWYPMLKELNKHGVSHGLVAVFLYNRAVKIALLPIMIFYFGWQYTLVLSLVMILFSVVQGIIFDKYIFK